MYKIIYTLAKPYFIGRYHMIDNNKTLCGLDITEKGYIRKEADYKVNCPKCIKLYEEQNA